MTAKEELIVKVVGVIVVVIVVGVLLGMFLISS
jgi:type II secretory pathway component PulF